MSLYDKMATAALLSGQYDDGLTTQYDIDLGTSPNHVQHNGIERTGIKFETGSAGIGVKVQSVLVRFRKYGSPTGNITVTVRKASDDTITATMGTCDIAALGGPAGTEQTFVVRNRFNQSYRMVANDIVSVELPSSATDGLEVTTNSSAADPSGYSSRSHNGNCLVKCSIRSSGNNNQRVSQ